MGHTVGRVRAREGVRILGLAAWLPAQKEQAGSEGNIAMLPSGNAAAAEDLADSGHGRTNAAGSCAQIASEDIIPASVVSPDTFCTVSSEVSGESENYAATECYSSGDAVTQSRHLITHWQGIREDLAWSAIVACFIACSVVVADSLCMRVSVGERLCRCSSNGTAAVGTVCHEDGYELCSSCHEGYALHDRRCYPLMCSCPGGMPVARSYCPRIGAHLCHSCNPGYHLNNLSGCQPNLCTCTGGISASRRSCIVHGVETCVSCATGFSLRSYAGKRICVPKCVCAHGRSATGFDHGCHSPGHHVCSSCKAGYHLEGGRCVGNVCYCPGGVAADPADCHEHKGLKCKSCRGGLVRCRACICDNGKPLTDDQCGLGGQACDSCHSGYRLVNAECLKECICRDGYPKAGKDCESLEAGCDRCFDGYVVASNHSGCVRVG